MLQPKRVKYRRPQDGRGNKGNAHRGTQLAFGSFGIKTLESKWIDSRQIEAARVALNRYMNRQGQVWIRIFPDKPITRKPADVRMGKGKGDPAGWVAPVTPGRILFEVEGVSFDVSKEVLRLLNEFTINRVHLLKLSCNNNGFIHFVADNDTLSYFS